MLAARGGSLISASRGAHVLLPTESPVGLIKTQMAAKLLIQ